MKTDAELDLTAGRVHGEIEMSLKHGLEFRTGAVDRLRQLERDAVLDFIESHKQETFDFDTSRLLEELAEKLGITRAPSGGCKDGRCGTRMPTVDSPTMKRCEDCNRDFSRTYPESFCVCGGRLQLV
jgi:hypothetical protein